MNSAAQASLLRSPWSRVLHQGLPSLHLSSVHAAKCPPCPSPLQGISPISHVPYKSNSDQTQRSCKANERIAWNPATYENTGLLRRAGSRTNRSRHGPPSPWNNTYVQSRRHTAGCSSSSRSLRLRGHSLPTEALPPTAPASLPAKKDSVSSHPPVLHRLVPASTSDKDPGLSSSLCRCFKCLSGFRPNIARRGTGLFSSPSVSQLPPIPSPCATE